jgi:hypothetical protein
MTPALLDPDHLSYTYYLLTPAELTSIVGGIAPTPAGPPPANPQQQALNNAIQLALANCQIAVEALAAGCPGVPPQTISQTLPPPPPGAPAQ